MAVLDFFFYSDLYIRIKTVTSVLISDIVTLKETLVLIHLCENTTFLSDDNKGRQTQFQKLTLQTYIFIKLISLFTGIIPPPWPSTPGPQMLGIHW